MEKGKSLKIFGAELEMLTRHSVWRSNQLQFIRCSSPLCSHCSGKQATSIVAAICGCGGRMPTPKPDPIWPGHFKTLLQVLSRLGASLTNTFPAWRGMWKYVRELGATSSWAQRAAKRGMSCCFTSDNARESSGEFVSHGPQRKQLCLSHVDSKWPKDKSAALRLWPSTTCGSIRLRLAIRKIYSDWPRETWTGSDLELDLWTIQVLNISFLFVFMYFDLAGQCSIH